MLQKSAISDVTNKQEAVDLEEEIRKLVKTIEQLDCETKSFKDDNTYESTPWE